MSVAGDLPVRADFLDEAAIARLLARRQAIYGEAGAAAAEQRADLLLWRLGAELYASPLADVRAVAPLPRITPIPGAPPGLLGLVSRRGIIHNLFDPAAVLGGAGDGDAAAGQMVVLRHDRPCLALRVSDLVGTVAMPAGGDAPAGLACFLAPPEGEHFALVSTPLLIERLLARHRPREG